MSEIKKTQFDEFDYDEALDEIYANVVHMRNTLDLFIHSQLTEGELVQEMDEALDIIQSWCEYED